MSNSKVYQEIRNTIAQIVSHGRMAGVSSNSLDRYYELVRLYDTACRKREDGCLFAVYGSPKMGKSTLFNSLVQEEVLPCRPIPTTGSIIDLKKDAERTNYEVVCERQGVHVYNHFESPERVCEFLDKYATQHSPCDSVLVTGPFPNAVSFVSHNCTLRDTPGAEAMVGETERVVDERLQRDSETALQSLKDPCIPLFCVSAQTIGQKQDRDFYEKFFKNRCCLHVLTHIDAVSTDMNCQDVLDVTDDFRRNFNIFPGDDNPNPVICTGITGVPDGATMVNVGFDDLVREMENYISTDKLGEMLCNVARHILDHPVDWDLGGQKGILFAQIRDRLAQLQ